MIEKSLTGFINKVKVATQQAADITVRQAKLARLRFDLMTLSSERGKHLQYIGDLIFSLHKNQEKFDDTKIFSQAERDIEAIESIDKRIEAIEAQLQAQHTDNIEVKDITPKN